MTDSSSGRRMTRASMRAAQAAALKGNVVPEEAKPTRKRSTASEADSTAKKPRDPASSKESDGASEPAIAVDEEVGSTKPTRKRSTASKDHSATKKPRKRAASKRSDDASEPAITDDQEGRSTASKAASPTKKPRKRAASKKADSAPEPAVAVDEEVETTCDAPWGAVEDSQLKVVTWNICSGRTISKSGAMASYAEREQPDLLFVQETKLTAEAEKNFNLLEGYDVHWNHSVARKGYSGVAVFASSSLLQRKGISVESVTAGMGNAEADAEGRVLTTVLSNGLALVNAYVPNAGGKLARLGYRTKTFEPAMRDFLRGLRDAHPRVVYAGDLNVAHNEIDIHNSKGNQKSSGHTPEERAEFGKLLDDGWVDIFRRRYPRKRAYSYFSRRFGDRMQEQNKGWRLDYHVTTPKGYETVVDSWIRYEQMGSDHKPVVLVLNR